MLYFHLSYKAFLLSLLIVSVSIIGIESSILGLASSEWVILLRMILYHSIFFFIYAVRLTTIGIDWKYSLIIMVSFFFESRLLILFGFDSSGFIYSFLGGLVIILSVIFMVGILFIKKI